MTFVELILAPIWHAYDVIVQNRYVSAAQPGFHFLCARGHHCVCGSLSGGYSDENQIDKIISRLKLDIPPRERCARDSWQLLQSLMRRWLPLSDAVLGSCRTAGGVCLSVVDAHSDMAVELLPDPVTAQAQRMATLHRPLPDLSSSKYWSVDPDELIASERKMFVEVHCVAAARKQFVRGE